jgi:SsrA-binding protein
VTKPTGRKIVCTNRKARHLYAIEEVFEAGLALQGAEVKSLRAGRGTLGDAYGIVKDGEAFLLNAHISPYSHADAREYDPNRTRKLLLHKAEIRRLLGKTREKGLTLVPLQIYFKNGRAKVELGLGRGKKLYDKREDMKRRDADREMARVKKGRFD